MSAMERPKPLEPAKASYQHRYVAFLDILGFRNLIARTAIDSEFLDAVLKACERLAWEKEWTRVGPGESRVYMFSDCLCETAAVTPEGLGALIDGVSRLCQALIGTGVFVRGAIVVGEVYEQEHVIFGPGVVAAYDNESKAAAFPRILVTDEVYAKSQSIEYIVGGRAPMRLSERIRRDFDGLYHVDWLCHFYRIYEPGVRGLRLDAPLDFGAIKHVAEYWLNDPELKKRVDIQAKMRWFASYFNDALHRGRKLNILGRHTELQPIDLP
jgi:hypothetical protein